MEKFEKTKELNDKKIQLKCNEAQENVKVCIALRGDVRMCM